MTATGMSGPLGKARDPRNRRGSRDGVEPSAPGLPGLRLGQQAGQPVHGLTELVRVVVSVRGSLRAMAEVITNIGKSDGALDQRLKDELVRYDAAAFQAPCIYRRLG